MTNVAGAHSKTAEDNTATGYMKASVKTMQYCEHGKAYAASVCSVQSKVSGVCRGGANQDEVSQVLQLPNRVRDR